MDSNTYLALNACVRMTDACATLAFYDTTGEAPECEDGYGASNVPLSSVVAATVQITAPDEEDPSTPVSVYPTLPNITDTPYEFEADDFGLNEFTDGVYEVTYTVTVNNNGTLQEWVWHRKVLIACQVECKIKALTAKLPLYNKDCCDCKDDLTQLLANIGAIYEAMMSAVCCGKETWAKKLLKLLQKKLVNVDCDCA